jgi:hypothetical protein
MIECRSGEFYVEVGAVEKGVLYHWHSRASIGHRVMALLGVGPEIEGRS